MPEEVLSGGAPDAGSAPRCPWCSAELPRSEKTRCPSCGASLHEAGGDEVPGVTRVDHEAILRSRAPVQKSRGLIGWLSGEYVVPPSPIPPETLAPPDAEVRREMLRLELAALEAEAQARRAELVSELADAGLIQDAALDAPATQDVEPGDSGEPEGLADT